MKFRNHTESLNVCIKRQSNDPEYCIDGYKLLSNKVISKNFVKSLGIATPKAIQAFSKLHNINLKSKTVLKPSYEAWSRGVYLIIDIDNIINLTDNKKLSSFEEVINNAKSSLAQKIIKCDSWNVEELILGNDGTIPPSDIKFFCFYGEVGLIVEKVFDPKKQIHCRNFYDGNGNRVSPEFWDKIKINGEAPLPDYFKAAKKISSLIPVPFIRIDFLKSISGPVFSEFEFQPGNLEWLSAKFDKLLGRYYLSAKKRLNLDITNKKLFLTNENLMDFLVKFQ